jgi:hypothetical protein
MCADEHMSRSNGRETSIGHAGKADNVDHVHNVRLSVNKCGARQQSLHTPLFIVVISKMQTRNEANDKITTAFESRADRACGKRAATKYAQ